MARIYDITARAYYDFDDKLPYNFINPILNDENGYSFTASMPGNYTNDKLLGFPSRPEISILSIKKAVIVEFFFGNKYGNLFINCYNGKDYEFNFIENDLSDNAKIYKLTDLIKTYDFSALSQLEIGQLMHESLDGALDYVCCPAHCEGVYDYLPFNPLGMGSIEQTIGFYKADNINASVGNEDFPNEYDIIDNYRLIGYNLLIIPFFYLKTVIREIFLKLNIVLENNVFNTDNDLKQLCLLNTTAINKVDIVPEGNVEYTTIAISDITREPDPQVTCSSAHGLSNGNYVKLTGSAQNGSGWDTLVGKIYKIGSASGVVFTLSGVNSSTWELYSPIVADLSETQSPVVDIVSYADEVITIQVSYDISQWINNDYVYICAWDLDTGVADGNYYRIEIVDTTNIKLLYVTDNLFPYYVPAPDSVLLVNLCAFSSDLQSIEINRHMPDILISDFLLELEKYLFLKFVFDGDKCTIVQLKDILNFPAVDLTAKMASKPLLDVPQPFIGFTIGFTADSDDEEFDNVVEITDDYTVKASVLNVEDLPDVDNENNDLRLVTSKNEYYVFNKYIGENDISLSKNGAWKFFSMNLYNKVIGDGSTEIISAFSPVICKELSDLITIYFKKPVSVYSFLDLAINNALRLFFYRGIFDGAPLSTNSVYDHAGSKIANANLSLDYYTAYSIYNNLAIDYITLSLNFCRDFKAKIIWPAKDLKAMNFIMAMLEGNKYLIKSVQVNDYPDSVEFLDSEIRKI